MEQNNKTPNLSKRLALCASFVRKGSVAADIGSDHALLPIYLVLSGISPKAIASDINEGPIACAKRNIETYDIADRIDTAVAPGLDSVAPGSVDDIIIAGMGGELIASILEAAAWVKDKRYRFVLQPMTRAEKLRKWLFFNGFEILTETAQCEGRRVYTVINAAYSGKISEHTQAEFMAGGLLGSSDPAAIKYLEREANILRKKAAGLRCIGEEEQAISLEETAEQLSPTPVY